MADKTNVQPIVKIGHYILGQTLGVGTFGKVKSFENPMATFWKSSVTDKEGNSKDVVEMLIEVVHQPDIQVKLADRRAKKDHVWEKVANELEEMGVVFPPDLERSSIGVKCREKYSNVQATYYKCKKGKRIPLPKYFQLMDEKMSSSLKKVPASNEPLPSSSNPSAEDDLKEFSASELIFFSKLWKWPVQMEQGRYKDVGELLIEVVHQPEIQSELGDRRAKKDHVWEEVVKKLEELGVEFPDDMERRTIAMKCREKYNNIQTTYYTYKMGKRPNQFGKKPPRYFSLMEEKMAESGKMAPGVVEPIELDASPAEQSFFAKLWKLPVQDAEGKYNDVGEILVDVVHQPEIQKELADRRTKKDHVWEEVANVLEEMGVKFPKEMERTTITAKCREKYNNIQSAYFTYKKRPGNSRLKPPRYYSLMEEKMTFSGKVPPTVIESTSSSCNSNLEQDLIDVPQSFMAKRMRPLGDSELLNYFKERDETAAQYKKKKEERQERLLNIMERDLLLREREAEQSQEIIELLKEFIDKS